MPTFETDRLILRQLHGDSDLDALFELFADPEVARYTDTGPFESLSEATEVMDWIDGIFNRRQGMRWALTLKGNDDTLIGTGGYNHWHRWNNSAEIGYDLAQRYWGQGLMTEALEPMLSFGFEQMALNRIEADVTVGNEASMRLLTKLGFQREGLLRQRGFWKGAYHDAWLFSLLHSDRPH
jgi:ribosomal-protein-alanine N-acetyltransferase